MNINPSLLFNSTLAFLVAGIILILKGNLVIGITAILISILTGITWFMSGLFEKFESTPPEIEGDDDKDEEGKGVLKPF